MGIVMGIVMVFLWYSYGILMGPFGRHSTLTGLAAGLWLLTAGPGLLTARLGLLAAGLWLLAAGWAGAADSGAEAPDSGAGAAGSWYCYGSRGHIHLWQSTQNLK